MAEKNVESRTHRETKTKAPYARSIRYEEAFFPRKNKKKRNRASRSRASFHLSGPRYSRAQKGYSYRRRVHTKFVLASIWVFCRSFAPSVKPMVADPAHEVYDKTEPDIDEPWAWITRYLVCSKEANSEPAGGAFPFLRASVVPRLYCIIPESCSCSTHRARPYPVRPSSRPISFFFRTRYVTSCSSA